MTDIIHASPRSSASYLLQNLFIRPFAKQLTKIRKKQPAGSPRLDVPNSIRRKCDVDERCVEGMWIYDIKLLRDQAKDKITAKVENKGEKTGHEDDAEALVKNTGLKTSGETRESRLKRVYFFAGGSFQAPPDEAHFKMLVQILRKTRRSTVISLISYPLAPESPAHETVPQLVDLYGTLSRTDDWDNEDICFAGDSSGGNIALAITMWCLEHSTDTSNDCNDGQERHEKTKAPGSLLLISPTVNMNHEHDGLEEADERDKMESLEFVNSTADAWAGDLSKDDPRISPSLGMIKVLKERRVQVYGIIAGDDVLGVEAADFSTKCQELGIEGRWLIWEKQMHNFPLTAPYYTPEGTKAVEWIANALDNGGWHYNDNTNAEFERIEHSIKVDM